MLLLFWRGAIQKSGGSIGEFTLSTIATFYFLLIIANSFLVVHVEENVALHDVKEGELVKYLLRPISYYWIKFNEELPYRFVQSFYGLIVFSLFFILFPRLISVAISSSSLALAILVAVLAYFISFTYKMCLGIFSLWVIDVFGLFELFEVAMLILSGMTIPIALMPAFLSKIALLSPFPYMIYFPIRAFQGKITGLEIVHVLGGQIFWLVFFVLLYKLLWHKGIYKFTAVGQ
jgi:ABC-2 type transport system permease protein